MTTDHSSIKINLKASTQLMKNQKAAQVMPSQARFKALQTANGQALFFSISDDGNFYLSAETPGSKTGWSPVNLSSDLAARHVNKKIMAKTFAAAQHPVDLSITIALVVAVEKDTNDHLYVVSGLSGQPGASWHSTPGQRQWLARPFDDKNHPATGLDISYIHLPAATNPAEGTLMVAGVKSKQTSFIQNYTVNTSPNVNSGIWKVLQTAENYSTLMGMHIGQPAGQLFPGLYELYELNNKASLTFTPLKSLFGPPPVLKLTPPTDASALAVSSPDSKGQTGIFVAGDRAIYFYPADKQTNFASGSAVIENRIISGVKELHTYSSETETMIWGLNGLGQVFYTRCDRGKEQDASAWTFPVPILENASQMSSFLNRGDQSNRIFAHTANQTLIHLNQDPVTSFWRQGSILLPYLDADDVTEFYTYTTHIQAEDENKLPLSNATFKISSTSPCDVFLNDRFTSLSNHSPIEVKTGVTGTVTVVQQVQTLGAVSYFLHLPDKTTVNVNPVTNIMDKMKTVKSGKQLSGITIKDEKGNERNLVPKSTSTQTSDSVAQSIQQFVKISQNLPQDGSSLKVKPPHPSQLLKRSLTAGSASHSWGMSFHDGGAHYFEGDRLNNLTGFALEASEAGSFQDAIEIAAGDIFRWIKDAWDEVKQFFIKVVDGIAHFFIQLGETLYRFIIKCISDVVHGVEFIFNKIKVFFKDLVEWLGFIFSWGSILRTKDVIKNIIKQYIPYAVSRLPEYKKSIDQTIDGIETKINQWAGLETVSGSIGGYSANTKALPGKDSPEANWGTHHLKSNAAAIKITAPGSLSAQAAAADSSSLKKLFDELIAALEREGKIFEKAIDTIKTQIADQIGTLDAGEIIKRLLAVLADTVLESIENILDTLLDIMQILLEGLPQVLDAVIEIPVISWLYKKITGSELSFLDLCCLVAAIPATIIFKLMMAVAVGEKQEPFPDNEFTNALIAANDFQQIQNLYASRPIMAARAAVSNSPRLSREQIDLELTFYLVSLAGSTAFAFLSLAKAEIPESKAISITHGIFFYLGTGSSLTASLIDSHEQDFRHIFAEAVYGVTVVQKFVDIFSFTKEQSKGMEGWIKFSKWLDLVLGILGLVPPVMVLIKKQTALTITAMVGSAAWNINRMLSPAADLNKTPKIFLLKQACVIIYGVSQPLQAAFTIQDSLPIQSD